MQQPVVEISRRHQTMVATREKTIRVTVDGYDEVIGCKKVIAWYSYGWYLGELSETFFAARIFDRFQFDALPHTATIAIPQDNIELLKNTVLPWVRTMTRMSKGKWSVAADNSTPFPRVVDHDVVLIMSFETVEDAVKFKLFANTFIGKLTDH